MKILDNLGPEVEIRNERKGSDRILKAHLADAAKHIQPEGLEYIGSVATHIYKSDMGKEVVYAHNHHFDKAPSESIVSIAVSDLALHLMQVLFNRKKPASRDDRDKRIKQ